jgi:hypothetical protein
MQDRAFVKKYSLQVEITLCLIMVLIIYMVSARLDLLEALFQFTQTHEAWELDELVPTAAFSSVVLMVFAFRRWMVSRALRKRLSRKVDELTKAQAEIRQLTGIVPICSACKKIRDDEGFWQQVESYVEQHTQASFTHSMCPDCLKEHYGNEPWFDKVMK